jgi:hypothetical protein
MHPPPGRPWRSVRVRPPRPPPGTAPKGAIALPPLPPHYIMPGSHFLDPPYSRLPHHGPPWKWGHWPFPRDPWRFESETRAPGTGLIKGRARHPRPC